MEMVILRQVNVCKGTPALIIFRTGFHGQFFLQFADQRWPFPLSLQKIALGLHGWDPPTTISEKVILQWPMAFTALSYSPFTFMEADLEHLVIM
jgi:hypothetical protein